MCIRDRSWTISVLRQRRGHLSCAGHSPNGSSDSRRESGTCRAHGPCVTVAAQGCNIELHYALGKPHLNDGARVLRMSRATTPTLINGGSATMGATASGGSTATA